MPANVCSLKKILNPAGVKYATKVSRDCWYATNSCHSITVKLYLPYNTSTNPNLAPVITAMRCSHLQRVTKWACPMK